MPLSLRRTGVLVAAFTLAAHAAAAQHACKRTATGTARVAYMRDGHTLLLADGLTLRLAAVEAGMTARTMLRNLTDGQRLLQEKVGADPDCRGRLVAFAFAGQSRQSLKQKLLQTGAAQVSARFGDRACAVALLAAERAVRQALSGLSDDPNFAPLAADNVVRADVNGGILPCWNATSCRCMPAVPQYI